MKRRLSALVGLSTLVALFLPATTAQAAALLFFGKPATIVGTAGHDRLEGRDDARRFASLIDDAEQRLFGTLPDETWVYPGHGKDTTPGRRAPAPRRVAGSRLVIR